MTALALGLAGCVSTTGKPVGATGTTVKDGPPSITSPGNSSSTTLSPMRHFRIGGDVYGPVQDCRVVDDAVTCTSSWKEPYQANSYTGSVTGTLSGLVMTGTSTTHQTGHDATDPSCLWQMETSGPTTFYFRRDGTMAIRQGPGQWRMTHSGTCSGTDSGIDDSAAESTARWTVIE